MIQNNNNLSGIVIDMREFHPVVIGHIRKNAMYSFSYITETDIINLVDPILSFLFSRCDHFTLHGNGRYNAIFLFYTLEDFIEQYDDLSLAFGNFLYFYSVSRYKKYSVYRIDNFKTLIVEHKDNEKNDFFLRDEPFFLLKENATN